MSSGTVLDGTVASSETQMQQIWPLRERIAEALLKDGYCYKYDISLPMTVFYDSVTVMQERVGNLATRVVGYGHIGDGNMHLNITSPKYDDKLMKTIEPFLYEWTSKYKGSVSAEHGKARPSSQKVSFCHVFNVTFFLKSHILGLGFKKRNCMHYTKNPSAIQTMKQIKQLFDPKGILNPYKVLPDE